MVITSLARRPASLMVLAMGRLYLVPNILHRQGQLFGVAVVPAQLQADLVALRQGLLHAQQHDVQATRLQADRFARGHGYAFHLPHLHHAVLLQHGVQLHFFRLGRQDGNQGPFLLAAVLQPHKGGGVRPHGRSGPDIAFADAHLCPAGAA